MQIEFADPNLEQLAKDVNFRLKRFDPVVTKKFRKVMATLLRVQNEQELREFKSLRVEKLKGDRDGQSSIRVHQGIRLVYARKEAESGRIIVVIEPVDYH